MVLQLQRGALVVARQLGFPLTLALIVLMFMAGQNRLDRREPKLALAPTDPTQDLLTFS